MTEERRKEIRLKEEALVDDILDQVEVIQASWSDERKRKSWEAVHELARQAGERGIII